MHRIPSRVLAVVLVAWAAQLPLGSMHGADRQLRVGEAVRLPPAVPALGGRPVALAPRDSAVAILVTTAECGRGRMGIAAFRLLEERLRGSGIPFRVVVKSGPVPSRQYARLLLHPEAVVGDLRGASLGALDTRVVPSLVVLDRAGIVVVRRSPLSTRPEDVPALAGEIISAVAGP